MLSFKIGTNGNSMGKLWLWFAMSALSIMLMPMPTNAAQFCVTDSSAVQSAFFVAASNGEDDEVRLVAGNYPVSAAPLSYSSSEAKALSVSGGWQAGCVTGSDEPGLTTIDGGGVRRLVVITAPNVIVNVSLRGLTFRNGLSDGVNGPGLAVVTGGAVNISRSSFQNNRLVGNVFYGGGAYIKSGSMVTIADSEFNNNRAPTGAAVYIDSFRVLKIERTTFSNNQVGASSGTVVDDGSTTWVDRSVNLSRVDFSSNLGRSVDFQAQDILLERVTMANSTPFDSNTLILCGQLLAPPFSGGLGGRIRIIDSLFQSSMPGQNGGCFRGSANRASVQNRSSFLVERSDFIGFSWAALYQVSGSDCIIRGNRFIDGVRLTALVPWCEILTVERNIFRRNKSDFSGAGALKIDSFVVIANISNNLFDENESTGGPDFNNDGGAVKIVLSCEQACNSQTPSIRVVNNTFVRNRTGRYGGALAISSSFDTGPTVQLYNNLFASNTAGAGGSDFYFDNDRDNDFILTPITMEKNGLDLSSAGYFQNIPTPPPANNYSGLAPQFVNPTGNNFRLSATPPFINAGSSASPFQSTLDLAGAPRLIGPMVDVGAYEFDPAENLFANGFE